MASESDQEPRQKWSVDRLAAERTYLADERTLLAYIRTALALFVTGASFLEFFDWWVMQTLGWIFMPAGIFLFAVGLWRFRQIRRQLSPPLE